LSQPQLSMEAVRHGLCGVRGVEARRRTFVLSIRRWLARGLSHSLGGIINYSRGTQFFRRHTLRFAGEHESGGFACYLEIAAVVIQYLMNDNAAGETGGVVPRETDTRYGWTRDWQPKHLCASPAALC
jgi:hypothetical protein